MKCGLAALSLLAVAMLLAQQGCRENRAVRGSGQRRSAIDHGAIQGNGENHATKTVAKISWDSPKMQEIEKEWHSLWDAYDKNPEMIPGDNGITRYINVVKIVHNLLGRRLSDKELRQLVAACDTLPADIENAGFVRDALAFMVKSFADSEDRESLVTLLSRRCPCHVDERGTIECVLAFDAKRLKDPILILGEAYAKCQVSETRRALAAAVRRGFAGLGIRGKDDADFVKNAMQWYEKEKDGLVVNGYYGANDADAFRTHPEFYDNPPGGYEFLFVKKDGSTERWVGQRAGPQVSSSTAGGGVAGITATGATVENDLPKLEGTWEITEATDDGKPVPQEKVKGARFVFRKDVLAIIGARGEEALRGHIRPGSPPQPGAMDLVSDPGTAPNKPSKSLFDELRGETVVGIYELSGDDLQICVAKPGEWARPTLFRTDSGPGHLMFDLKRLKEHAR
jgi:uncharacterized protein (TIGR03067 family)